MSKKNKKLKKKKPILAPASQSATIAQNDTIESNETSEEVITVKNQKSTAPDEASVALEFQYVKHDVKKILMLLALIIILLFGVYYLDLKTPYISHFGDWIYKVMNIQTQ